MKKKWDAVKHSCTGRIGSLIDLLRGKLDRGVMEVVSDRKDGLFPLPGEMKFDCDCPDWADMCKHVAAALYGVGARLDHSPEMLFLLRGVNHEELVDVTAAVTDVAKAGTSRRRIAATGIADVFGIELAEAAIDPSAEPPALSGKGPRRKSPPSHYEDPKHACRRPPGPFRSGSGKTKPVANTPPRRLPIVPRADHRRRHPRLAAVSWRNTGDICRPVSRWEEQLCRYGRRRGKPKSACFPVRLSCCARHGRITQESNRV